MLVDENRARSIDAICKIVTALAIAGAAIWAVTSYRISRADQIQTEGIQARQPFFEKRLELYIEVTTAASTIASSTDPAEVLKAKAEFWRLYWGPLRVVDELPVESSATFFGDCLNDASKCTPNIKQMSFDLAHKCSDSMISSWNTEKPAAPTVVTAVAN